MTSELLSKRAKGIDPSPTLAIDAKAKEMKARGENVVGFGAGEPDFDTPDNIKDAGIQAIKSGATKYTPAGGTLELKKAVAERFRKFNGLEYAPNEIVISCGAKHTLYNIMQAMVDPGDEVIVPSPYWVTYPEQVKMAGGRPVMAETLESEGFRLTAARVAAAITDRTKIIILNSPCNPTGAIMPSKDLEELAALAVEKSIWVVADEIYEPFVYDGETHTSIASLGAAIKKLTIVVNGVSKTYSMTGWRIGYAAGPKEVISAINNIQSHSTSNPASISQKAALEALGGNQDSVAKMVKEFNERRKLMVDGLNKIPGISCIMPKGAFYAFPNISKLIGKNHKGKLIKDSMALADLLLSDAKVAVVPGAAFGAAGYMRLSYAASRTNIEEGLRRIGVFVRELA